MTLKVIIEVSMKTVKPELKLLVIMYKTVFLTAAILSTAFFAEAASMSLSPSTGVYKTNSVFTANVIVKTDGKPVASPMLVCLYVCLYVCMPPRLYGYLLTYTNAHTHINNRIHVKHCKLLLIINHL